MRNPTKFGSLNLDTPSPRYHFLKLAQKSGKEITKPKTTDTDTRDPQVSRPHMIVKPRQGMTVDR